MKAFITALFVALILALFATLGVSFVLGEEKSESTTVSSKAPSTSEDVWKDPQTGYTWQVKRSPQCMTWKGAKSYCENLSLGGYDKWRMPKIEELRSLIRGCPATELGGACEGFEFLEICWGDPYNKPERWGYYYKGNDAPQYTKLSGDCRPCEENHGPGIGGVYWPKEMGDLKAETAQWFWSSFICKEGSKEKAGKILSVNFNTGRVDLISKDTKVETYPVCVLPFLLDDVWTDSKTKLMWQVTPTGGQVKGSEAKAHCDNLNLGGFQDWHMPTISELRSLAEAGPDDDKRGICDVTDKCISHKCIFSNPKLNALRVKSPKLVEDPDFHGSIVKEYKNKNRMECHNLGSNFDSRPDGMHMPSELEGGCCDYWSSSEIPEFPDSAWCIHFGVASVFTRVKNTQDLWHTDKLDDFPYVRCVRKPKENFSSSDECGGTCGR